MSAVSARRLLISAAALALVAYVFTFLVILAVTP